MEVWGGSPVRSDGRPAGSACGTGSWVYQPVGLLLKYFIGIFPFEMNEHLKYWTYFNNEDLRKIICKN